MIEDSNIGIEKLLEAIEYLSIGRTPGVDWLPLYKTLYKHLWGLQGNNIYDVL